MHDSRPAKVSLLPVFFPPPSCFTVKPRRSDALVTALPPLASASFPLLTQTGFLQMTFLLATPLPCRERGRRELMDAELNSPCHQTALSFLPARPPPIIPLAHCLTSPSQGKRTASGASPPTPARPDSSTAVASAQLATLTGWLPIIIAQQPTPQQQTCGDPQQSLPPRRRAGFSSPVCC